MIIILFNVQTIRECKMTPFEGSLYVLSAPPQKKKDVSSFLGLHRDPSNNEQSPVRHCKSIQLPEDQEHRCTDRCTI